MATRRTPAQNKIALCPVTTGADHLKRRAQPRFVIDDLATILVHLWRDPVQAIAAAFHAGFEFIARFRLWLPFFHRQVHHNTFPAFGLFFETWKPARPVLLRLRLKHAIKQPGLFHIRQRQFGCDSAYLHFGKLASSDHTNTATAVINDV